MSYSAWRGSTRLPYQIYAFHASSGSSRLSVAVSSTTDEETKTVDPLRLGNSPATPRVYRLNGAPLHLISASDWGLGNETMTALPATAEAKPDLSSRAFYALGAGSKCDPG
jgi:hypothetical protein